MTSPPKGPSTSTTDMPALVREHSFAEPMLARARTHWLFGDWRALASLDTSLLVCHPERIGVALLVASAHAQLGNQADARRLIFSALDWGCSRRLAAQVLLSGVHNTLGRVAALRRDDRRAVRHFEAAVDAIGTGDTVMAHARAAREMTELGSPPPPALLPAAASTSSAAPHEHSASTYSGLHQLDRQLERFLDYDNGFFVELGASDGVRQSNTLYFERKRGWHGILIEPVMHRYMQCMAKRSNTNKFYCSACVSFSYAQPFVRMTYADLMTTPQELASDLTDPHAHAVSGERFLANGEHAIPFLAEARTLHSILVDAQAPEQMDLLSLDVEGAELEVLAGLDHEHFRFDYILVECRDLPRMQEYLRTQRYALLEKLSHHDYLFKDQGP